MGHIEAFLIDGEAHEHVVFDIIRRWNPKEFKDGVIQWEPILEEVLGYCMLFRPTRLTFDQHQNMWPMEWLEKELGRRGIGDTRIYQKTANLEHNWNRAEVFRTALYQGRVHAPNDTADCDYAGLELKYLQEVKTARIPRVEKQDVGPVQTKDIADTIMEVVEALIGAEYSRRDNLSSLGLLTGAPGGYGIGKGLGTRAAPDEVAAWYEGKGHRHGEQTFSRIHPSERGSNPARRPFGGRPAPRTLPQRKLPGR
jgi:hypothetical protein